MIIKLDDLRKRGHILRKLKALDRKKSFEVANAVVLTGANGSGKTTLLNSIALSAGLAGRYSSSRTTYQFSGLDLDEGKESIGGAALYKGSKKMKFDLVLRFRGDETKARPIALDTMEDIMMCMGPKGSHGEVNVRKMIKVLKEAEEENKKGSRLLLLLDEPEAGLGLDLAMAVANKLSGICKQAIESKTFKIIIATQNPFILFVCEQAGAMRVDLGGWLRKEDPFEELRSLIAKGIGDGKGTQAKKEDHQRSTVSDQQHPPRSRRGQRKEQG